MQPFGKLCTNMLFLNTGVVNIKLLFTSFWLLDYIHIVSSLQTGVIALFSFEMHKTETLSFHHIQTRNKKHFSNGNSSNKKYWIA